jgi:cytochrome P450
MGALIAARDADGKGLTDDEVVLETLHFFFAAYGGMLALLTDLALALATHPEVAARARAEVEAHAAAKGPLTEATLGKLEYLERVCLETKRFYPVVPFTFFARARKDVVFNGCLIPAGMSALGCTHATARDESVFADPERFDPDRFGPERAEHRRHEYAFVAQGGGALTGHRCAGELFSLVVMKVFAAHLLRDYTWALPPQDLSLDMSRIPPTPRDGLRATIRRTPR